MTLQYCLVFSVLLFSLGAAGVVARRNLPVILVSIWIMFLGAAMAVMSFGRWNLLPEGMAAGAFIAIAGTCAVAAGAIFFSPSSADQKAASEETQGCEAENEKDTVTL